MARLEWAGTNVPYEDGGIVDATYLIRLVNLVGDAYFDGEQLRIGGRGD